MPDMHQELESVVPFEEISAHFTVPVERIDLRKTDLGKIASLLPADMFSLATHCAIRAKQLYKPDLDFSTLVPCIERGDPMTIVKLATVLGAEALEDIYCCRCSVGSEVVTGLLVAQVWPRDLYIANVVFADPSKPIPPAQRKSVLQTHRGLGLLKTLMERLEACAIARGCENLTLVANETSQSQLFGRYGFAVDDYPNAHDAVLAGKLIPMHKKVG